MTENDDLKVACPKCREEQIDLDGFGVLYCEKCGYCQHASITNDVCGCCGKLIPMEPLIKRAEKDNG